ncbi:hypothetical protein ACQZV8_17710 [Magnetococcales bacterium HHB-1]
MKGFSTVLGSTALVFAIACIPIPFYGATLTIIPSIMAAFAFGSGLYYAILTLILNLVNLIFMSPVIFASTITAWRNELWAGVITFGGLIIVQFLAAIVLMILHKRHKIRQRYAPRPPHHN